MRWVILTLPNIPKSSLDDPLEFALALDRYHLTAEELNRIIALRQSEKLGYCQVAFYSRQPLTKIKRLCHRYALERPGLIEVRL